MATPSTTPNSQFKRDTVRGESYHKLSDRRVAYSVELSDLVIADYDDTGMVRGIEFAGKRGADMNVYLELARKASKGPMTKRPKVPSGN